MDMLIEYNGKDCHIHQQIITRLVTKEIVTTIGDNAFEDYEVLKELKLCDGLRQIGNYSFKGCVALEKIEISSTLELICLSAFEGCIGATELIIPRETSSPLEMEHSPAVLKSIGWRFQIMLKIWGRWCS